jgi:hypothetical protein
MSHRTDNIGNNRPYRQATRPHLPTTWRVLELVEWIAGWRSQLTASTVRGVGI